MSETLWKWRMYLFVRAADATQANRQALAQIFVNRGCGETLANEIKMFDGPVRLSTSGALPAQVFGLNTAIRSGMQSDIVAFLAGLTNPRYVVVSNTARLSYRDGEYITSNFPDPQPDPSGKIVTWQRTLQYLSDEFGLQVIPDQEDV